MASVTAFLKKAETNKTLFPTPTATAKKAVAKTVAKPDHRARNYEKYSESEVAWKIIAFMSQNGFHVWRQSNHAVFDVDKFVSNASKYKSNAFHCFINNNVGKSLSELQELLLEAEKKWEKDCKSIAAQCYKPVPNGIKGVPDIIGFRLSDAKFVGIEIKINKDKMSEQSQSLL